MLRRLVLLALALVGCSGAPEEPATPEAPAATAPAARSGPPADPRPAEGRVVVLALPGLDPDWVDRWRRDLPNLDSLLAGQRNARLETTFPPNGAAAWTTLATGTTPGAHGVFGLVRPDPSSGLPVHGALSLQEPVFAEDGALSSPPGATLRRRGVPFWRVAAATGLRVKLLFVPWVWPPDEPAGVDVLAGEGLPDLRLTTSTFSLFGTDFTEAQALEDVAGGDLVPLAGAGPYSAAVAGPLDARGAQSVLPLAVEALGVDRVAVTVGAQRVEARVGAFSEWVTLDFPLSAKAVARARVRFFPIELGERVRLYMTPLTVDPRDPWLPAASPAAFGREVWETYGDWKALGWAFDTAGLSSELVPEAVLAAEVRDLLQRRVEIVLGEIGRKDAELVVATLGGADAVSHMFMRLGDPSHPAYDERLAGSYGGLLKEVYVELDRAVGEVRERLRSDDALIVLSEAGFQSFRREFRVNTWLLEQGYLKLGPGVARAEDNGLLNDQIDWRNTSAYALGSGFVYLNLKGRDPRGVVPPTRARALLQEMASRLLEVRDGRDPVFSRVLPGADLYRGPAAAEAPDLVLAFLDGYQVGRATMLGGVPLQILADNRRRWSGDHAASDPSDVQGLIATNLDTPPKAPRLVDVAPTVLALLGLPAPPDLEGRSWVELRPRRRAPTSGPAAGASAP